MLRLLLLLAATAAVLCTMVAAEPRAKPPKDGDEAEAEAPEKVGKPDRPPPEHEIADIRFNDDDWVPSAKELCDESAHWASSGPFTRECSGRSDAERGRSVEQLQQVWWTKPCWIFKKWPVLCSYWKSRFCDKFLWTYDPNRCARVKRCCRFPDDPTCSPTHAPTKSPSPEPTTSPTTRCKWHDWQCGQPWQRCDTQSSNSIMDICLCDVTLDQKPHCWNNIWCKDTYPCWTSSMCPWGWQCHSTCCGKGHCIPDCRNPDF